MLEADAGQADELDQLLAAGVGHGEDGGVHGPLPGEIHYVGQDPLVLDAFKRTFRVTQAIVENGDGVVSQLPLLIQDGRDVRPGLFVAQDDDRLAPSPGLLQPPLDEALRQGGQDQQAQKERDELQPRELRNLEAQREDRYQGRRREHGVRLPPQLIRGVQPVPRVQPQQRAQSHPGGHHGRHGGDGHPRQ